MPIGPEDLFTLNVMAPHLAGFRPPKHPHAPAGDWELRYGVYTLGSIRGHGGPVGSLSIRRATAADGRFVLSVAYDKRVPPGFEQKVAAEITCRGDALGTPLRWQYTSEIAQPGGKPVPNTRLEKSARAQEGGIELADGPHRRRHTVDPPFTINWGLFDAVGRLPREPFEPIRFTLLDDFDQPKANQTLSFRQTADVRLGTDTVRLHAYDHLGEGIVPWIYWVDESGRLLLAVSGLEACLYQPTPRNKDAQA